MTAQVQAHHYAWGDVDDLGLLDSMMEGLAQGGVLATRAWLSSLAKPLRVDEAFAGWDPTPPAHARDPRCQLVRIGPAAGGLASCLDLAIYHAAWLQVCAGLWNLAWVGLTRNSDTSYAHAIVLILGDDCPARYEDPSQFWKGQRPCS